MKFMFGKYGKWIDIKQVIHGMKGIKKNNKIMFDDESTSVEYDLDMEFNKFLECNGNMQVDG